MATMAEAKRDRSNGFLTMYQVKRWSSRGTGWFVWLGTGNAAGWLEEARHREPREFKTLDAAVQALEQIGFSVDSLTPG